VNQLEDCYNTTIADNHKPNLCVVHPADMAALQKTVGHGIENYACFCCSIHKNQIHVPNPEPCKFCKTTCFHQENSDEEMMACKKEKYSQLAQEDPYLIMLSLEGSIA